MAKTKYIEALEEQYTKKDAKSVLRYKAPDNKWRYVQTSKDASGGNMPSGGGMTEVTWQELKDKRDNGQLIAGSLYRITDYQCTTTQENTRSAGHQFDIVLLALSENKLAEEGWAMMHDNIYDVTFGDGVTKKCYIYNASNGMCYLVDIYTLLGDDSQVIDDTLIINEENKTATCNSISTILDVENLSYNYFQNSNLSAWKVWYCLDNDKDRFAWAQEYKEAEFESFEFNNTIYTPSINGATGNQVQVTINGSIYYQYENISVHAQVLASKNSTNIQVGDTLYTQTGPTTTSVLGTVEKINATPAQEEGRGVIYRLIDEWNNDVGYDFKNIQFKTKLDSDGFYNINGNDSWTYSLNCYDVDNSICYDASIICATLVVSDMTLDCYDNFISRAMGDRKFVLQYNQIFTNYSFDDEITNSAYCIKMFKSANARIGFSSNVGVYGCSLFNMEYEGDAIYINNKKVLTES